MGTPRSLVREMGHPAVSQEIQEVVLKGSNRGLKQKAPPSLWISGQKCYFA